MEQCSSFRGTSSWGDHIKMGEVCVKKVASRVERTFRFCHFCISCFLGNACKQDCPSAFLTCSLPEISMNELALSLRESLPSVPPILLWSPRIEVIQDQDDALGRKIVYVDRSADEQGKGLIGATGRHFQISLANQW